MINSLLTRVFGSRNERLLKQLQRSVTKINALEPELEKLSDEALKAKTPEFQKRIADGESLDKNAMPSRMPIANSYITSGFGGRADPLGGGSQYHRGIDFEADVGDPVLSVADGVVSFAGVKSGYGNVVDVDHGNGYVTRYAHNSRLVVRVGDLVRVGQEIAKAGSTGRSTGAHVHFEVWENGRVVNPRKFLGEGPTPVGQVKRG